MAIGTEIGSGKNKGHKFDERRAIARERDRGIELQARVAEGGEERQHFCGQNCLSQCCRRHVLGKT